MKPRARVRTVVKWGGVAAILLLVVVWIGSGWRGVGVHFRDVWVNLENGRVSVFVLSEEFQRAIASMPQQSPPDTIFTPATRGVRWWFEREAKVAGTTVWVPLWVAVVAAMVATWLAWRLEAMARRRAKMNLCATPGCGYDLSGLASGAVCPECGRAAA